MVARSLRCRRGFTLAEMMVVIAIIAVLLAIAIPAVMKVRAAANRTACSNNLRQIALAVHMYHNDRGHFPVNTLEVRGLNGNYGPQTKAWSWMARLLPYLEESSLYEQGNIPNNTLYQSRDVVAARIAVFLCPSDDASAAPRTDAADLGYFPGGPSFPPYIAAGPTNYKGVSGANWMWGDPQWHNPGTNGQSDGVTYGDGIFYRADYLTRKNFTTITDGLSKTFMIGEDIPKKNHWCAWAYANDAVGTCAIAPNAKRADGTEYDPGDWYNVYSFRSRHSGGLHFAYADASVHFIKDNIDLKVYRAMATIRGREPLSADD